MMDVITGKTKWPTPPAIRVLGQSIDLTTLNEAQIAHAGIGRNPAAHGCLKQHSVF